MTVSDTVHVNGSHGTLTVDALTGAVLNYSPDGDKEPGEYADIVRVDVDEFRDYYREPLHASLDILDVGFWTQDGSYAEPDAEFRARPVCIPRHWSGDRLPADVIELTFPSLAVAEQWRQEHRHAEYGWPFERGDVWILRCERGIPACC